MFESKIIDKNDHKLLVLGGDLDLYAEDTFKDFISKELVEIDKDLILDLKNLNYLDSTGLGLFMKIYKICKENQKSIKIINPKENIYKLFKITDLTEVFSME